MSALAQAEQAPYTTVMDAHLIHYRNHLGNARMGPFFHAQRWDGEPYNAEPHKCSQIAWWPLDRRIGSLATSPSRRRPSARTWRLFLDQVKAGCFDLP
ncbi:hypothetical protein [Actinomadura hibisca]|uniref:hypothetical protein n=1 Tax=Actinomadura hibisca TaxID=68565 RepID=UPI0008310876|nr:hypothetical protein [Actinomadura hibisca]